VGDDAITNNIRNARLLNETRKIVNLNTIQFVKWIQNDVQDDAMHGFKVSLKFSCNRPYKVVYKKWSKN